MNGLILLLASPFFVLLVLLEPRGVDGVWLLIRAMSLGLLFFCCGLFGRYLGNVNIEEIEELSERAEEEVTTTKTDEQN